MASLVDVPLQYDVDAVLAAEDIVRSYCGWHISPSVTETITLDGNGGKVLILPTMHVTAITSVVEDGTTLSVDDYSWSQIGLLERVYYRRWPRTRRSVQVTLTHGYPQCPPAVRREVARIAAAGYSTPPVTEAKVGQVSFTYDPEALSVLDAYRLPGLV